MDDPFRLRVMKVLSAQIKRVNPTNGYASDLSDFQDAAGRPAERVFRGRTVFGDNDPRPMVVLLEDPRPPEFAGANGTSTSPMAVNQFRVLIQGFVEDDRDHPLDPAYRLSAEVVKALVEAKSNRFDFLGLGNKAPCVMSLSIGQPVHRPADDEVSSVAFFLVPVTLGLAENLEMPFA
ncbi:hypothetical protein G6L74_09370 [Agrobacterium tumefaciens]|uniref:hypothetical protein n=1 Tax=Agrobacterium tumefaciens TaxID=358 RepID=UPI00157478A2|nr:hypothetical protein [Agrobacterium tumefaciens]